MLGLVTGEMAMKYKLSSREKELLRNQLYQRDGKTCHYCGIVEDEFNTIWGDTFYGGVKRGRKLEIDRKDNTSDYDTANCVLACAICNMAKSDKFTCEEFRRVGDVIKEIWQKRMQ